MPKKTFSDNIFIHSSAFGAANHTTTADNRMNKNGNTSNKHNKNMKGILYIPTPAVPGNFTNIYACFGVLKWFIMVVLSES